MLATAKNETEFPLSPFDLFFSRDDFINSPLKLASARHFATLTIQNGPPAMKGKLAQKCIDTGILSKSELDLCLKRHMVIPSPRFVEDFNSIPGWHFARMDGLIMLASEPPFGPVPVYLLSGVFDLFTGGHDVFVRGVLNLAQKNKGRTACLVDSDYYSEEFKHKLPIFPAQTRASWFRNYVKEGLMLGTWPDYFLLNLASPEPETSLSWVEGYQLIRNQTPPKFRKNIHIVIPKISKKMPEREANLFKLKRQNVLDHGFSVDEIPQWLEDISTSILRDRFQLQPISRDRIKLLV